jgi:hydrogenase maturation protein HypF
VGDSPGAKGRRLIELTGIVQGVGFRPTVYRLARERNIKGFVRNDGRGVTIDAEGEVLELDGLMDDLKTKLPPRASIQTIKTRNLDPRGYTDFTIDVSGEEDQKTSLVSPDIATCPDCLSEILDPKDRRFRYPFTNCTNCGPRFTIVRDIPYDRKNTTMSVFRMCSQCASEYGDPENRRFHAQPNACPVCGPRVSLTGRSGEVVAEGDDAVRKAAQLLKEGKIVATKGLGGFHLACDAMNPESVVRLRRRKYREDKPFALMAPSIAAVSRHCLVSSFEKELLESPERPIVLLEKREDSGIARDVAPGQKYLGFMLPYTPLHHLLLRDSGLVLVMTSGNISDEPISYKDDEARDRLKAIADYFLVHAREIETRCDDSVTREFKGRQYIVRRGRGYSPKPIALPFDLKKHILSCGGELKNTFCLARDNSAFLSHYVGDLKNLETFESFTQGIEHYSRLFSVNPEVVAHDLHPDYLSTRYALGLPGVQRIGVQHHHAHVAAVMVENGIEGDVIGVALDGAGYGTDGKIWGCEFMVANYHRCGRVAHLDYLPMPGGDAAAREPYRMAVSYLDRAYGNAMFDLEIDIFKRHDRKRIEVLLEMARKGFNSPQASSAGRLFDAVSSIVSLRDRVNYEGQAAVDLEMDALESSGEPYPYAIRTEEEGLVIDVTPMIRSIVDDLTAGVETGMISATFHRTMALLVLDMCRRIRESYKLGRVALSGGVFQNMLLLSDVFSLLEKDGFQVFIHHVVPTNDGCVSLGQVAVANAVD